MTKIKIVGEVEKMKGKRDEITGKIMIDQVNVGYNCKCRIVREG